MARKRNTNRATKPENPLAATSTPNLETQVEALVTFLDTSCPVHGPTKLPALPEPMITSNLGGLPQDNRSMRSKEDRVRGQALAEPFHSIERDPATLFHELKEENDAMKKIMDAKTCALHGRNRLRSSEAQELLEKQDSMLHNSQKLREKQTSRLRDSQVLRSLSVRFSKLAGHIPDDERIKLEGKLHGIMEQMKVTSLNSRVLLNYPDGSSNENAFEQEAAVQNMLQDIADLETNIKQWACVNNSKESAKTKEPVKEVQDTKDTTDKIEPLRIRSGQGYKSGSMRPMDIQVRELAANSIHSPPGARDTTADSVSVPEPDGKTKGKQPAVLDLGTAGGQNSRTGKTAPLPIDKTLMYAYVSHPKEILDFWFAFWNGDNSVRSTLSGYLTHFPQSMRDEIWDTHMDWLNGKVAPDEWNANTQSEATARQAEKAVQRQTQEPVIKPGIDMSYNSEQLSKKLETLQKPFQEFISNNMRLEDFVQWDPLPPQGDEERFRGGGPELQRHKAEGILKMGAATTKTREKLEPYQDDLKKLHEQMQEAADKSLESYMQREETEGLLKLREEHLLQREKQHRVIDKSLYQREGDVLGREIGSEKHRKQQVEIERLLQLREEQLQKRDEQLYARERMFQTHEDRWMHREEHLLSRERLLRRREGAAETRLESLNQQAAKLQAEIEKGEDKLAQLANSQLEVKRKGAVQGVELDERAHAIYTREAAVASREQSAHKTPTLGASALDWAPVLELAVRTRVYVDGVEGTASGWGPESTEVTDLKRVAMEVEKEAKKVISNAPIKGEDLERISRILEVVTDTKVSPAPKEPKKNVAAVKSGWDEYIPAATSKKDVKPTTSSNTFETAKRPSSTPTSDCSGKWHCQCAACGNRNDMWKAHKEFANKNDKYGAEKVQSSPPLEECTGESDCRCEWCLYPSEKAPAPVSSSTKAASSSNWANEGHEKLHSSTRENDNNTW